MVSFEKVVHPGSVRVGERFAKIFIRIKYYGGKLSISGVIGPLRSGNARGGCGQINMEFEHRNPDHNDPRYGDHLIRARDIRFADGWNAHRWLDLLEIWHDWHLNDMRQGCEHQVGEDWNASRPVTLYRFRLADAARLVIREAKRRAEWAIKTGETFTPTAEETRVATLPDVVISDTSDTPGVPGDYEPSSPLHMGDYFNAPSETKPAGQVRYSDHPLGLMGKPCPVCGYKYGTEYRHADVPGDLLSKLQEMPEASEEYAWA